MRINDKAAFDKENIFGLNHQFLHCYKISFKEQTGYLDYLSNKTFICKYMNKSFKKVLDFFDYSID